MLKSPLEASYLSKLGCGGQYSPETQDQVFSLDAMRIVRRLERKQREQVVGQEISQISHQSKLHHFISSRTAATPVTEANLTPVYQLAYHSLQLNTAQPRLLPTLPLLPHPLEGIRPSEETPDETGCGTEQTHSLE